MGASVFDVHVCYAYTVDVKRLPKQWWDTVLDGSVYEVDVPRTGYQGVNALRSAVYQQADMRFRLAATHKSSPTTLVVQAWGAPGLAPRMPQLYDAATRPAPRLNAPQEQPPTTVVEANEPDIEALLGPCSCGQAPTCAPDCSRFA